ncbi:MAG: transporter, periplasmic binding protein thiB subfamily [Nocardioidaceae bacterium]|nr:transporter, periplasmic binding protein thiB subfamily [Nocardioidaceae bacterium]
MMSNTRRYAATLAAVVAVAALPGCAFSGSGDDSLTLTLVTHDSWAMDRTVMARFEKQSGYHVKVVNAGDAGALTNKLVLTKDDPIGDVVYGIDNTFASRAVDAGILADHTPADPPKGATDFAPDDAKAAAELTPVDYGDVCVNVDDTWFAQHQVAPPVTLDDLTEPAYKDLFVVPGPATSSPGLAFLFTTIAAKGESGWQDYWKALVANGVKVDAGWSDAYEGDFTAGGGSGARPIVLSYASSIPFTIPKGATEPTTSALLDTCFRQVEYAGVVKGGAHAKAAGELVDFMQSAAFQKALPDQMYVYPVATATPLPADWEKYAQVATKPWTIPATDIADKRATWLREWRDVVVG